MFPNGLIFNLNDNKKNAEVNYLTVDYGFC